MQRAQELSRDVYVKPSFDFELESNKHLQLLQLLYGLADSGDYWVRALKYHLEKDLRMKDSAKDGSFFLT